MVEPKTINVNEADDESGSIINCVVCGNMKAQLRFGAKVCHSCAVFFGEIHKDYRILDLFCKAEKKCKIAESSLSCSYCRLPKCLENGMDINEKSGVTISTSKIELDEGKTSSRKIVAKTPNTIPAAKSRTKLRCMVCLRKADGSKVNGIPCCSACRLFYFRNRKHGLFRLICNKNETCSSLNPRLNPKYCRLCKLKKCLDVGMDDGTDERTKPAVVLSPFENISSVRSRKESSKTSPGDNKTDIQRKQLPDANTKMKTFSKKPDEKKATRTDPNEGNLHRCMVCLNKADKNYNGVPCCSACRMFFFRNQRHGLARFSCNENDSCTSFDPRQNPQYCRLCRLKNCFQVGLGKK